MTITINHSTFMPNKNDKNTSIEISINQASLKQHA